MLAPAQQQPSVNSTNQRAKLQIARLLVLLKPWKEDKLIKNVRDVYNRNVKPLGDPIPFFIILSISGRLKILRPKDPSNPQRLRFDPAKAQQFLNKMNVENLPSSQSRLSTAASIKTSPKKKETRHVANRNVDHLAGSLSSLSLNQAIPGPSGHGSRPRGILVNGHSTARYNEKVQPGESTERTRGIISFLDQKFGFKETSKSLTKKPDSQTKVEEGKVPCKVCDVLLDLEQADQHFETDQHQFRECYSKIRSTNKNQLDKPPRELTGELHHITVQSGDKKEGHAPLNVNLLLDQERWVAHRSVTTSVDLLISYDPPEKTTKQMYLDSMFLVAGPAENIVLPNCPRKTIPKGKPVKRVVEITENSIKREDYMIVFKFIPEVDMFSPGKPIFVMKRINVRVDNEVTREDGEPAKSVPWSSPAKNRPVLSGKYEPIDDAEKPPKPQRLLEFTKKLEMYDLTPIHRRFINSGMELNANVKPDMMYQLLDALSILAGGLSPASYKQFMTWMLYLEEHQTMCDLRVYSMKNTPLFASPGSKKLVSIEVPGLAENRPSVLKGDAIYVTLNKRETYKGWVHRIAKDKIHVSLGQTFMSKFIDKMKATVDFSFNRICMRMEHRALEIIEKSTHVSKICFPTEFGAHKKNKTVPNWINNLIGKNPEQARAVQNILNGSSLPAPYLVFGPPGTGKTVTIVEAIKQIYFDKTQRYFILTTAPSNAAADVLAERILESVPRSELIRLYSPSREWSKVPEVLQNSCNFYDSTTLKNTRECCFPALKDLLKFRIIITTLICAGRLVSGNFPVGHFTHIFVDECGHGMETTALVPVAGLLSSKPPGQLVLSGDPCQLGPIIRSPVAKKLGFGQSLLERLMNECQIYKKTDKGYNSDVLTKLVRNFRSHPAILEVSNKLFYENELKTCGENGITHSICNWKELPNPNFPIIFHGVEGKDQQDDNSPSFYNIAEVDLVVQYAQKVMNAKFRGQKLKPSDVGIVCPYRKQIEKLHRALERKHCLHLSVGSAEEFQGQERRVIIVSTVRSDPARVALDNHFRLGFLREPKRFNVAMTRAKALLIVVGNPNTLQHDPNWHSLLEHAVKAKAYVGCKFTLKSRDAVGVMRSLDELRESQQSHFDNVKLEVKMKIEQLRHQGEQQWLRNPQNVSDMLDNIRSSLFSVPQSFPMEYMADDVGEVSAVEHFISPPFHHQED